MELILGCGFILGFTSTKPKLGKRLATIFLIVLCIKPVHGDYVEFQVMNLAILWVHNFFI